MAGRKPKEASMQTSGSFIFGNTLPEEVFTPEDFSEAHRMIINIIDDFMKNEVSPHIDTIEHQDFKLIQRLIRQAGELGLLGTDVEEEYGGSNLDSIASIIIAERVGGSGSFGVTLSIHSGIGTLPLVFFGNKAQKERYLAPLTRGEKIGAYALTEPKAGTDALSIETKATLSPDGKYYTINGVKQFITNGGIAETFFTYAKVNGDKMTAFVVERDSEGVSTGPEEKKLGICGTSTTSLFLDSAMVPAENVIFKIGKGHQVAFNILNIGRFKVAAGCLGMAKQALEDSVKYAKKRVQFSRQICQFGLMKCKIAEMATKTYMAESMIYRTAGLIDAILATVDRSAENIGEQSAKCIAEYAIECSINKVYCSEILAHITDEAVQMHGGYGYCEDYPAERLYRDSRIFRIYEGTNEINRVIIAGWLAKKATKNEIPILTAAERVRAELPTVEPLASTADGGPLEYQRRLVERAKKLFLISLDAAIGKHGETIDQEQEVLGLLSDMAIELYAMDSGLQRALKAIESCGEQQSKIKIDMVRYYTNSAMPKMYERALNIVATITTGESLDKELSQIGKLSAFTPIDSVQAIRDIADRVIEFERYTC